MTQDLAQLLDGVFALRYVPSEIAETKVIARGQSRREESCVEEERSAAGR